MIVVIANIVLKDGMKEEFVKAALTCVRETRKEEGNISYTLMMSADDDSRCAFIEEWTSQAALDAHMKTPHFHRLGEETGALVAGPMDVHIYEAEKKN